MFTDWQHALDAEGLPLNPNSDDQQAATTRTIARHTNSKEDLVRFTTGLGEWPGRPQVRPIHRRGERLSQIQEDSLELYAAHRLLHRAVPPWGDR